MPVRILIADDNASVRAAMRQVLHYAGDQWEIVEAENGAEAVIKAQELIPNLIIVDLVMPLMDGLTAAKQIARTLPDIPILMHTLYPFPQVRLAAEKAGVRNVVPKSDSNVLVSAVERVLNSQKRDSIARSSQQVLPDGETAARRTEDKIRELCSQLFATNDDKAHSSILIQLQQVLHQHIEKIRERVADYPAVEQRLRSGRRLPDKGPASKYGRKD